MREYKIKMNQVTNNFGTFRINTTEPIHVNMDSDIITIGNIEIILDDFMITKVYEARKEYVELEVK